MNLIAVTSSPHFLADLVAALSDLNDDDLSHGVELVPECSFNKVYENFDCSCFRFSRTFESIAVICF